MIRQQTDLLPAETNMWDDKRTDFFSETNMWDDTLTDLLFAAANMWDDTLADLLLAETNLWDDTVTDLLFAERNMWDDTLTDLLFAEANMWDDTLTDLLAFKPWRAVDYETFGCWFKRNFQLQTLLQSYVTPVVFISVSVRSEAPEKRWCRGMPVEECGGVV